ATTGRRKTRAGARGGSDRNRIVPPGPSRSGRARVSRHLEDHRPPTEGRSAATMPARTGPDPPGRFTLPASRRHRAPERPCGTIEPARRGTVKRFRARVSAGADEVHGGANRMSHYECDGCGVCCRSYLIFASESDAVREPRIAAEGRKLPDHLVTPEWTYQLF